MIDWLGFDLFAKSRKLRSFSFARKIIVILGRIDQSASRTQDFISISN